MPRTKYYHADEVAEILGIPTSAVYKLLISGELKGHKYKHHWLIDIDQEYLNDIESMPENAENTKSPILQTDMSFSNQNEQKLNLSKLDYRILKEIRKKKGVKAPVISYLLDVPCSEITKRLYDTLENYVYADSKSRWYIKGGDITIPGFDTKPVERENMYPSGTHNLNSSCREIKVSRGNKQNNYKANKESVTKTQHSRYAESTPEQLRIYGQVVMEFGYFLKSDENRDIPLLHREEYDHYSINRISSERKCGKKSLFSKPIAHPAFTDILYRTNDAAISIINLQNDDVELSQVNFGGIFSQTIGLNNSKICSKSVFQIYDYVKSNVFDDVNWNKISQFCEKNGVYAKRKKHNWWETSVTYNDFMKWIDSGVGKGDVVIYKGNYEIAGSTIRNEVILQTWHEKGKRRRAYNSNHDSVYFDAQLIDRKKLETVPLSKYDQILKTIYEETDWFVDWQGTLTEWARYVRPGILVKVKHNGTYFYGKISDVCYNYVTFDYIINDGELQPSDGRYTWYEISQLQGKEGRSLYESCLQKLHFNIKTDEYILYDDEIERLLLNFPQRVEKYASILLKDEDKVISIKELVNIIYEKECQRKSDIYEILENVIEEHHNFVSMEIENEKYAVPIKNFTFVKDNFLNFLDSVCEIKKESVVLLKELYQLAETKFQMYNLKEILNKLDCSEYSYYYRYPRYDGRKFYDQLYIGRSHLMKGKYIMKPKDENENVEFFLYFWNKPETPRDIFYSCYRDGIWEWLGQLLLDESSSRDHYRQIVNEAISSYIEENPLSNDEFNNFYMTEKYIKFIRSHSRKPNTKGISSEKELASWFFKYKRSYHEDRYISLVIDSMLDVALMEIKKEV